MQIDLYTTEADAEAGTNKVASDEVSFGTGVEATLVMEETGTPEISLFNAALSYHLKVSGVDADVTKTFHIAPFVDLPDINNSIYRSESLIQARAAYELNKHIHTRKNRQIEVANHNPALAIGDIIKVDSNKRSITVLTELTEVVIIGAPDLLINQISTDEYVDLTRI